MRWQFFVSLRYLASKRKEKFISIISLISIAGVAIGVAALIVVLGVMSGFDRELEDKLIGTTSHIVIESDYGVRQDEELISKILKTEHVVSAAFILNGQALIKKDDDVGGLVVKGVNASMEIKATRLGQYITEGRLDFGQNKDGAVIGGELARRQALKVGDRVLLVTSTHKDGMQFIVTGIFTSGIYDYDANVAYVDIAKAQELFNAPGMVSGVSVKISNPSLIFKIKKSLQEKLGYPLFVRTWMDLNRNLLSAIKLEKTVMFIILTLIVMVACFNIASTLIMTVLEKTKDIGVLKAIGANSLDVMTIFALQGGMIGFIGTGLGASIGLALSWLLKTYKFINLPSDIYYLDKLPVNVEAGDVLTVVISSLLISLVATIYPSYKASQLDPVEALRYE